MNARAVLRRTATGLMAFAAVLLWILAWLVTPSTGDSAAPGGARNLPPIAVAPGTAAVDDPAQPYVLTVPTGFAVKPFPVPGAVELVPESWLPTPARITVTATELAYDTAAMSTAELAASSEIAGGGPAPAEGTLITTYETGGARVIVSALGGGRLYSVCRGRTVVHVHTVPPDERDTYDPNVLPRAAETVVASLTFR